MRVLIANWILSTKVKLPPFNPIYLKIAWGVIGQVVAYKGKCPRSQFACGYHRTGWVPLVSLLDNGAAGDICRRICMDCGKVFKDTCFIPKDQPQTAPWMARTRSLEIATEPTP